MSKTYSVKEKAKMLASDEVGWWKAHHYKDFDLATDMMTKEYQLQFGLPYELAREAVDLRIEAAKMHDKAEKYHDDGNLEMEESFWKSAERLLRKHFEIII